MGAFPRLHVITDDGVLGRTDFLGAARDLLERGGPRMALHLRGHATAGGRLYALGDTLHHTAASTGSWLFVNDRIDIALAVAAAGVQLGRRSIPIPRARALIGARWIGYSAHSADEASTVERDGTDFVVLGTIYPTASHPSAVAAGPGLVRQAAARVRVPVIAIGGITPERVGEVVAAGAHGAAAIRGVWSGRDDVRSRVDEYLAALAGTRSRTNDECGGEDSEREDRSDECEMMNAE